MISNAEAAQELLDRRRARASILDFARYTHPSWQDSSSGHHAKICHAIERLFRREIRKLMISAAPRHTKTELATRRGPAWMLGQRPDMQIMAITHSDDLARDNGSDVLSILKEDRYQHLFPGVSLREDSQAAGRWRTKQGGIFYAAGIGGSYTGRGYDIGAIDDPYKNRAEADSERIRDVTWRRYWGDFKTRQQPNAGELLMGTRWRPDDLFGRLLEIEGDQTNGGEWFHLLLPALVDEGTDHESACWPERFPLEELRKVREGLLRAQRSREWNSQYQQRPSVEEGTYCLRKWFSERWTTIPKDCRIYIASDYAVTEPGEGREPDFTEHGVFGYAPDKRLYVLDWWSGQTAPDGWIDALISLIQTWHPSCLFARKGGIRNSVEPLMLRMFREHQISVRREWMSDSGDKAEKGRPFQGMASMGRVIFGKSAAAERVVDQCVEFPGCEHDDAFDVMANMCGAIDQANPGIVAAPVEETRRDRYREVDGDGAGREYRGV